MAGGRIDTVIEEPDAFYIIEFKFGASAKDAIEQIKNRHYSEKFKADGKPVFALGIGVECKAKKIGSWENVQIK